MMSNLPSDPNNPDRVSGIFIPLRAPDHGHGMQLSDWCSYLLTRKLLIISTTLIVATVAIAFAYLSTPVYRAEILLAPNSEQADSSILSGIAGQFDSLSSITGMNIGDDSATEEAIATLTSRDFTIRFVQSENLMPVLFADKWNATSASWSTTDPEEIPSDWDAYELFDTRIRSASKQVSGLLIVAVEWQDRELAARWANRMVANLNELMRRRAIDEATANIEYLQQELQGTNIVELKTAISRLIEAQVKSAMLARVRDQYSFRVIDPAVAPDADQFVRPSRILIILFGILFGLFLGILASIMTRRDSRKPA